MFSDLQAHVDPERDWYGTPLDQVWAVYERWRAGEQRAFARAATSGQLAMLAFSSSAGEVADRILQSGERLAVPDPYTSLDGTVASQMPSPHTPYPVAPGVAKGLGEALAAGLLVGPAWSSWAASAEGLPLCRIWGRVEAAM